VADHLFQLSHGEAEKRHSSNLSLVRLNDCSKPSASADESHKYHQIAAEVSSGYIVRLSEQTRKELVRGYLGRKKSAVLEEIAQMDGLMQLGSDEEVGLIERARKYIKVKLLADLRCSDELSLVIKNDHSQFSSIGLIIERRLANQPASFMGEEPPKLFEKLTSICVQTDEALFEEIIESIKNRRSVNDLSSDFSKYRMFVWRYVHSALLIFEGREHDQFSQEQLNGTKTLIVTNKKFEPEVRMLAVTCYLLFSGLDNTEVVKEMLVKTSSILKSYEDLHQELYQLLACFFDVTELLISAERVAKIELSREQSYKFEHLMKVYGDKLQNIQKLQILLFSIMRFAYKAFEDDLDLTETNNCFDELREGITDGLESVPSTISATKKFLLSLVMDASQKQQEFLTLDHFDESQLFQEEGVIFTSICELVLKDIPHYSSEEIKRCYSKDHLGDNDRSNTLQQLIQKIELANKLGTLIERLKRLIDHTTKKYGKQKRSDVERPIPEDCRQMIEDINNYIYSDLRDLDLGFRIRCLDPTEQLISILFTSEYNQMQALIQQACDAYNGIYPNLANSKNIALLGSLELEALTKPPISASELSACLLNSTHYTTEALIANDKHALHLLDALHLFAYLNISYDKPSIILKDELRVNLDKQIEDIYRRIGLDPKLASTRATDITSDYQMSSMYYGTFSQNKQLAIHYRDVLSVIVQAHYESVNLVADRGLLEGAGEIDEVKKSPIYQKLRNHRVSHILDLRRALLATFSTEHLLKLKHKNSKVPEERKQSLVKYAKANGLSEEIFKCIILDIRANISKHFETTKTDLRAECLIRDLKLHPKSTELISMLVNEVIKGDEVEFDQIEMGNLEWIIPGMEQFVSE
jgi:hypothetical protein